MISNIIIPAAGSGSRLGRKGMPKALVKVDGVRIIHRQLMLVERICGSKHMPTVHVVGGSMGMAVENQALAMGELLGITVIYHHNPAWETTGPSNSVKIAFKDINKSYKSTCTALIWDGDVLMDQNTLQIMLNGDTCGESVLVPHLLTSKTDYVINEQLRVIKGKTGLAWSGVCVLKSSRFETGDRYIFEALNRVKHPACVRGYFVEIDTSSDLKLAEKFIRKDKLNG